MKKTSEHPQFDVFLSHSSVDKLWVTQLKNDLLRYGVSVWLDKDEIRPGDLFAEALEKALNNCRTVALVVSPEALASGWVKEEYYRALSLAKTRESSRQVIPVILRDTQIPGFLQSRNWVDFRDQTAYSQNLWKLVWGITGQKPEHVLDLSPLISAEPQSVKLEITPIERLENNCPHISVVVKNRQNEVVFCKVESHGIYNSSGEDIKRSVSSYANHFSWAGGSDRGTKEIPPNLDGIINLAKVNNRGYGIAFLFDENPHSYWQIEDTYKLDLKIVGIFGTDSSGGESTEQRVIVEFEYIKNEFQDGVGGFINNSKLKLVNWRLIDTD